MIILRYLLFPFSILYGFITSIRNYFYDYGVLKSNKYSIPVIAVGNLSVGGTGKTPQIEYLIRLLSNKYKVGTLSRGYKRKSKGFILANENATVETLGDEPFQMFKKFPKIKVAVDADRSNGIEQLLSQKEKPEVILLDDAFQHRKVKAGFYIMLSAFDDLYYNDFMLPTGNLRESRSGAKRADMIIITKCPKDLSELAQQEIKDKIGLNCPVFFSYIDYDNCVYSDDKKLELKEIENYKKIIVAGIAKPKPFFDYLKNENDVSMEFPDHHHFSEKDIQNIKKSGKNFLILTTEKDFVRLNQANIENLFYLPIKSSFINDQEIFENQILNYVGTSTRNG
jgi:tetraacyldisaccharide 4'-kinase